MDISDKLVSLVIKPFLGENERTSPKSYIPP